MGEEEDDAVAVATPQVTRIYIGGLSASVTVSDMEKTFSSLGRVCGADFVRTSGRNFGYMDFQPNSDKSLAKLFSTYNHCTWKGGKLKLEIAKEHYLARLKREWAEDAKHVPGTTINPDILKTTAISRSDRVSQESTHLQIFFPKLRKMKPVPFKGTGRHKYSFQRIEVPSLPIHFCDCEEHCAASETASQKYLSSINTGLYYDKELNIMNTVMNKLFDKEENEISADKMAQLAAGANISEPSISKTLSKETEEALELDADNLVTNIGRGRSDDILMQLNGREKLPVNQKSRFGKLQSSKHALTRHMANSLRQQQAGPTDAYDVPSSENAQALLADKVNGDDFTTVLSQNISSEDHPQEPESLAETPVTKSQADTSTSTAQSTKGHSWVQKSSWRDLVGGTGNNSFSISHVLPGLSSMLPKLRESNDSSIVISPAAKKTKAWPDRGKSISLPVIPDAPLEKAVAVGDVEMSGKAYKNQENSEDNGHTEPQKNGDQEPLRATAKVGIGEVCTFMRSAESKQEWTKARAALSGFFKKKKKKKREEDDDALKSLKCMPRCKKMKP